MKQRIRNKRGEGAKFFNLKFEEIAGLRLAVTLIMNDQLVVYKDDDGMWLKKIRRDD